MFSKLIALYRNLKKRQEAAALQELTPYDRTAMFVLIGGIILILGLFRSIVVYSSMEMSYFDIDGFGSGLILPLAAISIFSAFRFRSKQTTFSYRCMWTTIIICTVLVGLFLYIVVFDRGALTIQVMAQLSSSIDSPSDDQVDHLRELGFIEQLEDQTSIKSSTVIVLFLSIIIMNIGGAIAAYARGLYDSSEENENIEQQ